MAKETQQRLFGGSWTQEKLELLSKYLHAYTTIFTKNPQALFFETTYVDAFAGTGTLVAPDWPLAGLFPQLQEGVEDYQKGSARGALEVEPQFDHYIFVEKDKKRFNELLQIKADFATRDIGVKNEDANVFLRRWCSELDTSKSRAVVFLDPFGANVQWATIKLIAATRAIDLWLLFPIFAVNRMLVRDSETSCLMGEAVNGDFRDSRLGNGVLHESQGHIVGVRGPRANRKNCRHKENRAVFSPATKKRICRCRRTSHPLQFTQ